MPLLTALINNKICGNSFPNEIKQFEVIPLFKKEDPKKEKYHPVSLVPHISKVFWEIS